ncbi:hypothetical protein E1B28_003660 [Marasmius oreades]|uniref:Uncharacterized protein n=1 Tax=Marasmius oreades TaxID=181124 RepID=A0A9P8AB12_9AGAR|nr:uncharacterized protein E1B28_003660 [Marasmius oreades]KAG7096209.1 hypothetical protein E1B28_003660 [Marasmius oreades]
MSSTSEMEEVLAPYLSAESILTETISTLSMLFFIYGIYCFIFGVSIYVLFNSVHRLYKVGNIALFVLATIFTSVYTWGLSQQAFIGFHAATTKDYTLLIKYLNKDDTEAAWGGTTNLISTLMNNLSSIADTMLIHRCYLIFNSNKLVLFPLVVAACILNGIDLGCIIVIIIGFGSSSKPGNHYLVFKASSIDNGVAIGIVVFQIILASLTGGRIWWITRQARQLMGGSTRTRYNDIVAIIVESGLLYAGSLLTTVLIVLVFDSQAKGLAPFDFIVVAISMSGLAPTMIIVRVAYRKSVESVQQTISTFHIVNAQTGSRQATNDFQLQTQPGITVNDSQGVEERSAILTVEKV